MLVITNPSSKGMINVRRTAKPPRPLMKMVHKLHEGKGVIIAHNNT